MKSSEPTAFHTCDYLEYVSAECDVVLHGSNQQTQDVLNPARAVGVEADQSLDAVYATDSAPEANLSAILDRKKVGSFSSTTYGSEYSIDQFGQETPWRRGVVDVLPSAHFKTIGEYWICHHAVTPLAAVAVSPCDFPYLDQVEIEQLPYWTGWIFRASPFGTEQKSGERHRPLTTFQLEKPRDNPYSSILTSPPACWLR